MAMQSICVICGSKPGARPEYLRLATELGELLGRR
jgi:predicted Rossmann-fold nucleotide-binding protein